MFEEDIIKIIKESNNLHQVCNKLGKKPTNEYYNVLRRIIVDNNIDTSHFCVDNRERKPHKRYKFEEIFVKDSPYTKTSGLAKKLFDAGIKEARCEECGLTEWNGKPIVFQTHHINGDPTDNRIENLKILCPNCHSQTDNFCKHKNKKLPILKKEKKCKYCGKTYDGKTLFCSNECKRKFLAEKLGHSENPPTKEDIISMFSMGLNFCEMGRRFNISDNAIRKWCKKYGLPFHAKDIKGYIVP